MPIKNKTLLPVYTPLNFHPGLAYLGALVNMEGVLKKGKERMLGAKRTTFFRA